MMGESIIDNRIWISKAHHPAAVMYVAPFISNKVICCVRNPLDIFPSWASFLNTGNHSVKAEFDFEKSYPDWWNWFVRHYAKFIRWYFDTLINDTEVKKLNPIYFVRYEDVVKDMEKEMTGMMEFLLDLDTLEGTNAQRRIREQQAKGKAASQPYQTKATTGIPNVHKHRYTEE